MDTPPAHGITVEALTVDWCGKSTDLTLGELDATLGKLDPKLGDVAVGANPAHSPPRYPGPGAPFLDRNSGRYPTVTEKAPMFSAGVLHNAAANF